MAQFHETLPEIILPAALFRKHPGTGNKTPVWPLRTVAAALGESRDVMSELYIRNVIPATIYGMYREGPLVSFHQILLLRSLMIALHRKWRFEDQLTASGLARMVTLVKKEWNNDKERLCGNQRDVARWKQHKLQRKG